VGVNWRLRSALAIRPRDPGEPHRVSTSLELLFDLTFVVAVGRAAGQLGHAIVDGDLVHGLVGYLAVFFAIWWAWMNFTWFASAYDCDDAAYRVVTLVQMGGVLVLAAGVPAAFAHEDFRAITFGYVVMRVAMIVQWLRAAAGDSARRHTALGYAAGIFVVQLGWVARLALPHDLAMGGFLVLVAAEVSVPLLTERQGMTPWHPHHVAERYGLFTIIVLGESVTASSAAMSRYFDVEGVSADLVMLSGGGLVMLFGMWWIYFMHETGEGLAARRHLSFVWGYSHLFVAASAAALGASLEAAADVGLHHGQLSGRAAALVVGSSVCVFLLLTGYLHGRLTDGYVPRLGHALVAAVVILAVGWLAGDSSLPGTVLLQGLVVSCLVAVSVTANLRTAVASRGIA
jgi:low temperature requirement protein LtrA